MKEQIPLILIACITAIPCAILGCFLVLRKAVMIGDAISHSVLPGIVITFIITQSFDSTAMLIGASLMGLVATLLIEFFSKTGRLQVDASIGVTFTGLFALGVILVSVYGNVDLDAECVLMGDLEHIISTSGEIPAQVWHIIVTNLVVLTFIGLFYKELLITSFDNQFASSSGVSSSLWHYLLMGVVSLVTVACFKAVGSILVVLLLVVPAATAYLLTNSLRKMILLSILFSVLSSIGGVFLAYYLDTSSGSGMALCLTTIFLITLCFSPSHGAFKEFFSKRKSPFIH